MASITINNLGSTGFDLFRDSETYLHDLSEVELSQKGGMLWLTITVTTIFASCGEEWLPPF